MSIEGPAYPEEQKSSEEIDTEQVERGDSSSFEPLLDEQGSEYGFVDEQDRLLWAQETDLAHEVQALNAHIDNLVFELRESGEENLRPEIEAAKRQLLETEAELNEAKAARRGYRP